MLICIVGVFLLIWQGVLEENPSTVVVMAGCALVGVPLAGIATRALRVDDADER